MSRQKPFTEQLRQAIENCGVSRYRISQDTGVSPAVLCRFVHGQSGMSLETVDTLVEYLGLELRSIVQAAKKKGR